MRKISVIMASYLREYTNSAKNKEKKFVRAVNTFLNQTYSNKELIIIADGCTRTYELYQEKFEDKEEVECVIIGKQELYSGEVRNEGISRATGDIICYLDNDDAWGKKHLEKIEKQFTDDVDWVYYDDYVVLSKDFKKLHRRVVEPRFGSIGTSSIAHRNLKQVQDEGLFTTGYGHDWLAVLKLASLGLKFKKIHETPAYLVCHLGDKIDF